MLGLLLAAFVAACSSSSEPEPRPWTVVGAGLSEALLSVGGTSASDVWAVGADKGGGPLVIHYDGTDWKRIHTGTTGDLWWVQAFEGAGAFAAGANATIVRIAADGQAQRMVTPGVANRTLFGLWGSSPSDVWAVGSIAGRAGFAWRYDGRRWSDVPLPDDLPRRGDGEPAGLLKVWGRRGEVWMVGSDGAILRWDGARLVRVDGATRERLFTVHGSEKVTVAVGGGTGGVILEASPAGGFRAVAAPAARLLQGVHLEPDGSGYATGAAGTLLERTTAGLWRSVDHGLSLDVESLHSVWVDPRGATWAVGGNVLSSRLDAGVLVTSATGVAPLDPRTVAPPPGPVSTQTCPASQIDPEPNGSVARRWNEQILGAIRRDLPRPGVHARNLFHLSVALWDAYAAYDGSARGYVVSTRAAAADPEAARREAMSYAALRVLLHRYASAVGGRVSADCFRAFMGVLGYDPGDTATSGDTPRAVGNRVGQAIIDAFRNDGANESADYADTTGYVATNPPLVVDVPGTAVAHPLVWQELNLAQAVTQNGIVLEAGVQKYIGSNWSDVTPFAIARPAGQATYSSELANAPRLDRALVDGAVEVIRRSAWLDAQDGVVVNISPAATGNNSVGRDDGNGRSTNPATGAAYAPVVVSRGDFGRALAEFWADGPKSETPPGHWNVLANAASDRMTSYRVAGTGVAFDRLGWDVRLYFGLNGALHDAAVVAWELKRRTLGPRPITLVRLFGSLGQSSEPGAPDYNTLGLPLVGGLIERISDATTAPGQRHAHLRPYRGELAVRGWRGEPGDRAREVGGVGWIRVKEWIPYQRRTFVTPAFPGFVSGHSTFSRAAAEFLSAFTGTPFFPGGLGEHVVPAQTGLGFERGPGTDVRLQWATYFDAADQAGQSRVHGGIHIQADDFAGRRVGAAIGQLAFVKARAYYDAGPL